MAESYTVEAKLVADLGGYTNNMSKAASQMSGFEKTTSSATSKISDHLNSLGKGMAVAGAAITAIGVKSLKSFGDFQASLNQAAVIAGGTSKDIKGLADVANKMGADLPLSAKDAADAMVAMARDGASIGTIKKEFPAIAQAATAAGSDLQATASLVQQSMNLWGKSLKSPQRAAAILTQTANVSNASIEDMQQVLADVGGTATTVGYSMQDVATAVGLLTNRGIPAAQAAQNLNFAITRMIKPSNMAQSVMDKLGLSYYDTSGNMKSLSQVAQELNGKTKGLSKEQKNLYLTTLFGQAGFKVMSGLMAATADQTGSTTTSWKGMSKAIKDASKDGATATDFLQNQAAEMQKNVGSKLEQVSGNWEALSNTAQDKSSGVSIAFLDMTNAALNWANQSHSPFAQVIQDFIGLAPVIGPATAAIGGFLTQSGKIVGALQSLGGLVGVFGSIGASAVGAVPNLLSYADSFLRVRDNAVDSSLGVGKFQGIVGKVASALPSMSSIIAFALSPAALGLGSAALGFWAFHDSATLSFSDLVSKLASGDIKGVMNGIKSTFDNIVKAFQSVDWASVFAPWQTALSGIGDAMDVFATKSDTAFGSGTQGKIQTTADKIEFLATGFTAAAGVVGFALASVGVVVGGLAAIFEALARTVSAAAYALSGDLSSAADIMSTNTSAKFAEMSFNVGQSMLDMTSQSVSHMNDLANGTAVNSEQVKNLLTNNTAEGSTNAINNLNAAAGGGQAALSNLSASAGTAGIQINSKLTSGTYAAANNSNSNLNAAANGAQSAMSRAAASAGAGANQLANNVTNGANQANNGMNSGMSAAVNTAGSKMSSAAAAAGSHNGEFHSVGSSAGQSVRSGIGTVNLDAAGSATMHGFLRGLQSAWGDVKSFISGVGPWIKAHKGPITYDRKLLTPAGHAIMGGLNEGLSKGFTGVMSNVSSMAGNIANVVSGSADYRINAVSSGLNIGTDGTLSVDMTRQQQPATINLSMGGSTYRGFVDDISTQQGQTATLNRASIV
ncbi:hypothetical protein WC29P3_00028 [Weissella phage WC29P3]|nr:hypothetical protein WC29P3_00028 [Weissella phage WC29P3]